MHQVITGVHPLQHRLVSAEHNQCGPRQTALDLAHATAAQTSFNLINWRKHQRGVYESNRPVFSDGDALYGAGWRIAPESLPQVLD